MTDYDYEEITKPSKAREIFLDCMKNGGARNIELLDDGWMTFEAEGQKVNLYAAHYNTGESGLELRIDEAGVDS